MGTRNPSNRNPSASKIGKVIWPKCQRTAGSVTLISGHAPLPAAAVLS
ncbi:hypothetical protein N8Z81_05385 [Akkermansiaceae bacterium]|nr:hypothetical protein [Akkermansiaceae bacterium]